MPIASVKLRPGVNVERTITLNEAGYSATQLCRFKDGLVQSIGGWVKFSASALSSIPRCVLSYIDLQNNIHTVVGADSDLYSLTGNVGTETAQDITPRPHTISGVLCSTTLGSAIVTLTNLDGVQSFIQGLSIYFVTPVSIGGIILQGGYPVTSYISSSSVTITASAQATATVTNGGTVPEYTSVSGSSATTVTFNNHGLAVGDEWNEQISTSVSNITIFGNYVIQLVVDANNFTIPSVIYAIANASTSENGGVIEVVMYGPTQGYPSDGFSASFWTLDHFGQNLLGCAGGPIFVWPPNYGLTVAQAIPEGPQVNGGIFVAMPAQILVAWASSINGVQQKNLVQWSDQLNYASWTPTVTNQAGNFTIPTGSRIVGAIQAPNQAYIFTDVDVYAMTYLGGNTELVFGFTQIAKGCGLIGSRAVGILNQSVFWLSPGQFMTIGENGVQSIPCPIWDIIFQDLDTANLNKIVCAPNSQFNEIGWFYPSLSGGTGENDSYVKLNTLENAWDYGKLVRTAWQDFSAAGTPVGGDASGFLYQHEMGQTAAGSPLNWSWETGVFMISEGDQMSFVDWMLPDFRYGPINNASLDTAVNVIVNSYRYANDTPVPSQTLTCSATGPGELSLRQRGRAMQIQASGTGFVRLGNLRYRAAPDGKY